MAASAVENSAPNWLVRAAHALLELYPQGVKLFWLAPLPLALVVLPEFIQHVVEIRLGMFDSREAFRALQFDSTRMFFGYVKVGGLFLAFLATARFWWTHDNGGRWFDLRQLAWGRLLLGLFLFFGVGSAPELFKDRLQPAVYQGAGIVLMITLLPALFLMLAGLFGDRSTSLREMYRSAWRGLVLTAVLVVVAFAPAAWLHQRNHIWSLGNHSAVIWAIMTFDAFLVGLLAGLTGTALYLGYSAFAAARRS